ncbi:hypothetical protein Z517_04688 [Fonsecaea pedrosoi CBS 271.37]|uniref:C2H2-type domain-containing protein n=1 Tax=Fonsecaea pedrosoi CBS 271.37 TaxID=1442368 RepID=A0A0D2F4R4_9EURO|nr:uncharacterized protein Z517_04688 [Fonsecaea pedrosoi CBS 271.37]KIW81662.1 hypothetical protein Z517_04688 [Fonsecaea pedrosoi CBS 271.37]
MASSSSANTVQATPDPRHARKKFVCAQQNCGKSFVRREHLHRHESNHKDGDLTCRRCAAHFRRRDLLERHVQRHRQKDAEAGGEGLGNLATKKRLWRDSAGRIVNASRPQKTVTTSPGFDARYDRQTQATAEDAHNALPSPPISDPSTGLDQMSHEQVTDDTYLQGPWQSIDLNMMFPTQGAADLDFLSDSWWSDQSYQTTAAGPCGLPYNDVSFPDTTISFSTSLPTLQYYSWLFGNDFSNTTNHQSEPLPDMTTGIGLTDHQMQDHSAPDRFDPSLRSPPPPPVQFRNEETRFPSLNTHVCQTVGYPSTNTQPRLSPQGLPSYLSAPTKQGGANEFGMIGLDSPDLYFPSSRQTRSSTRTPSNFVDSPSRTLPDTYIRRRPTTLPMVTNEARDGLLQLIAQARPTLPDKSEISPCDPLLSLQCLQRYSDLFFTRFNSTYPLIHAATFQSSKAHPLQLMSIVLLGATYGDKRTHLLAVCVHNIMRPLIHSSKDFGPRPKLWMLQTILLVECFGKSRAGERQHDMSNLYHGLQINLLRRSDCHNAYLPPWDEATQTLEDYWHMAIEAEEKRRLALISFMWDTQHAIFFAQILCLNASELKVTLPWDTAIWEADTAEEWLHLSQNSPAPLPYLTVLQMYTDPSVSSAPMHLNALSRILVFHGLMSLSWDFRRRDQTALNKNATSTQVRWQAKISACYAKWKEDFDRYTRDVLSTLSAGTAEHGKFQRYVVANSAVYHTAQLVLEVETADLQIHAGAKHITGRPVTDLDRQRSRVRLNEYMTRDDGKGMGQATWHAARLIRDGIRKLDNWDVDDMILFPWCLYLATLTCWTTYSMAVGRDADEPRKPLYDPPTADDAEAGEDDDDDWDSRTDMNALVSALTRLDPVRQSFAKDIWSAARTYRPHGLLNCVVKTLATVRWAVVREGVIVLTHLIDRTRGDVPGSQSDDV